MNPLPIMRPKPFNYNFYKMSLIIQSWSMRPDNYDEKEPQKRYSKPRVKINKEPMAKAESFQPI